MSRPEERELESQARKELIKKAMTAWAEIFPRQAPVDDKSIEMFEKGIYVVGDRYPIERTPNESYLSGVRMGYDDLRGGISLYANDYHGDPAPLLIKLAEELAAKGTKITIIGRQGAYDPPDPEATKTAIDAYISRDK